MKNNLPKILVIAAFCMLFGGAAAVYGQSKIGGYRIVSVNDEGVKDAADFALEIKADEMDEVAGTAVGTGAICSSAARSSADANAAHSSEPQATVAS